MVPDFPSEQEDLRERIARRILAFAVPPVLVGAGIITALLIADPTQKGRSLVPALLVLIGSGLAGVCGLFGRPRWGIACLILTMFGGSICGMTLNGGLTAPSFVLSIVIVTLVAAVSGPRWTLLFIALMAVVGVFFLYAERIGWIRSFPPVHSTLWLIYIIVLTAVTGFFAIVPNTMLRQSLHESRRQAEELQRANAAERARALEVVAAINQTFQLMWMLTPEGRIERINDTAVDLIGIGREQAVGMAFAELPWWSDEQRVDIGSAVMRTAAGEKVRFQSRLRHHDGRELTIDFSLSPFRDQSGAIIHLIAEVRDISELIQAQARLYQAEKVESLGLLAGSVAHDFNNVLASIIGFAELVEMRSGDPQIRGFGQNIVKAAFQGRELTTSLLDFVHKGPATGPAPYSLDAAVSAAVAFFRAMRSRSIALEVRLDGRSGMVLGWPSQIQNAVLNLCLNARDAMPNGGTITVSTAVETLDEQACRELAPYQIHPGRFLRLQVADNGIGMDSEVLGHCLEPFFTTKGKCGTGLGLTSVHGAVVGHRGALRITSALGAGATFALWFPAQ